MLQAHDREAFRPNMLHLQGMLYGLTGIPLVICTWCYDFRFLLQNPWIIILLVSSCFFIFFSALFFFRNPRRGKLLAYTGFIFAVSAFFPIIITSPMATLTAVVLLSFLIFFVHEHSPKENSILSSGTIGTHRKFYLTRASSLTVLPFIIITFLFYKGDNALVPLLSAISSLVVGIMGVYCSMNKINKYRSLLHLFFFSITTLFVLLGVSYSPQLFWFSLLWPINNLILLPHNLLKQEEENSWLEPLVSHPARLLILTFFALSVVGTILLMLPVATSTGNYLSPIDAAFTSVSAVCVTGLIILDTPVDFSITGQIFILILIQTGGLGIMTIATITLHALGKRFSLKHERVLATMSGVGLDQLYSSFKRIIVFTLVTEAIGAIILFVLFSRHESCFFSIAWRSVFTSVSAFCNAGFALQSNSLINYQHDPLILHTIAILIILGGLSPIACLFIPRFLTGQQIPIQIFLILIMTGILLIAGTVLIASIEWDATLRNLSYMDRLHNAWFQSATLRTAGFNSIDISLIQPPTFIVMASLMFIGGSPGGTAGGIKTITLAVIILSVISIVRGRTNIIIKNQRIDTEIIYKAIAVIGTGFIVLFVIIMTLELTQTIPSGDIIFEAFSALGTVGLSTGATVQLDDVGKIIIIIAMFWGRIGPLTMFMFLSVPIIVDRIQYPAAKISIT